MIKHSLHQLSAKIEDLKTQIKTSEQTYPYQGIKDAINSSERKFEDTLERVKEEVSISFTKSIKLMEDACLAIIIAIEPLKQTTDNLRREAQSILSIQVTMIKEIYEKVANIHIKTYTLS